MKKLFEIIF